MDSDPRTQDELLKLTQDNNKMLRNLLRRAQFATVIGVIRWSIVILFTLGAYIYIQPYLQKLLDVYTQVNDSAGIITGSKESLQTNWEEFKNLFSPQSEPTETQN